MNKQHCEPPTRVMVVRPLWAYRNDWTPLGVLAWGDFPIVDVVEDERGWCVLIEFSNGQRAKLDGHDDTRFTLY